jgi:hypothetical protein
VLENAARLRVAVVVQRGPELGVLVGDDGGREQRGIDRAGPSDRERADRHTRRHLDDAV